MIEFIQSNLPSIITILVIIVGLTLLYKAGKKDLVKNIVLALVVQAEKGLGSGTGELKYAMVINNLYDKLPFILRFLYSKKEIDAFIEQSVQKLKEILSKGITLTGYDDEKYIDEITNNK